MDDPSKLKAFLNKKRGEHSKQPTDKLVRLLRQGLKLGYSLSGKNMSSADEKNMKVASPRFLSVMPEVEDEFENLLSPSLFSLHNEGNGVENLTSLPSLMKGFSQKDQQEWMNLIMEAADVVEHADTVEKVSSVIGKSKYTFSGIKQTKTYARRTHKEIC